MFAVILISSALASYTQVLLLKVVSNLILKIENRVLETLNLASYKSVHLNNQFFVWRPSSQDDIRGIDHDLDRNILEIGRRNIRDCVRFNR